MPTKKLDTAGKARDMSGRADNDICFVISPIGREGTKEHTEFKETLEYVIKPAIEESEYKYSVIRADDINRSGSFIKDILDSIYAAHIVIADLTGQNPNVFYELGVRHSLRPRTILIAQNLEDIPSDLREYRTIIYNTSAKGAASFKKRIRDFLKEISKEPERPDNPVLDRLGSITENMLAQVENENASLRSQLSKLLSGKLPKTTGESERQSSIAVRKRFERILNLRNAEQQSILGAFFTKDKKDFSLPSKQGSFRLYFLKEESSIAGFWYASIHDGAADIDEELADVRVLIEGCSKGQDVRCEFIIVVGIPLPDAKEYLGKFEKMKAFLPKERRDNFYLYLLDPKELEVWEKKLGLKV